MYNIDMGSNEPRGHRGHPSFTETRRAARIQVYLERAIRYLEREGFSPAEAVAFIAGIASEKAFHLGEDWTDGPTGARETIRNILDGRAAKDWSEEAIILALFEVGTLLGFSPEGSKS